MDMSGINARLSGTARAACAIFCVVGAMAAVQPVHGQSAEAQDNIVLETKHLKYVISARGQNLHFIDKQTGKDYCKPDVQPAFSHVFIKGKTHPANELKREGSLLHVGFENTDVEALLRPVNHGDYLVLEVAAVEGDGVDVFTFIDIALDRDENAGSPPFAGCALALNLQTNVLEFPRANPRVRAMSYAKFGFANAQAALIGCPTDQLRAVLQKAVAMAPELPHSPLGGPWAMDHDVNRGSYLFNFNNLTEETVDDWIKLAKSMGINQIDFHGGTSFRFGDCKPNPELYPRGFDSLKAVIDKLHEADIKAGLHTYAFLIDKDAPWVTPVPDPRLGKDGLYTLAKPLTADADVVYVEESTEGRSTDVGWFKRNSATIQIDDELIVYAGLSKEPPYAFTKCQRGALGTKVSAHQPGAKVHHLKQAFLRFSPDGDSTLLTEVAAKTAEAYNKCGFDMMYLDALDAEGILGGYQYGWHYGSKFVFELFKRLEKPPVMEMSTFHHHLWYVRSRMGAWDHPSRSHKKFIDIHCQANSRLKEIFLPAHLGWWAVKTWHDIQSEPTFADDIEYLMGKCIGYNCGFSVMGVNPSNIGDVPAYQRLGTIMKNYEALRHADYFDASVKARLRQLGEEFNLYKDKQDQWRLRPATYIKHKVRGIDGWSNIWTTKNEFEDQPVKLRIEALMGVGSYDSPEAVTLFDPAGEPVSVADQAKGIKMTLGKTSDKTKVGDVSLAVTASNTGDTPARSAWAKAMKTYDPPMNLNATPAIGVWVHGDGQGQVLNLQYSSPPHLTRALADHYMVLDFKGWRYFELVEPEGIRYTHYDWPYGHPYAMFREKVLFDKIQTASIWMNNVEPGSEVTCALSTVKALPTVEIVLKNPSIQIGNKTIRFPVELASGQYLEFVSPDECYHYGRKGELIQKVTPTGDVPTLESGSNELRFNCETDNAKPRARVTVMAYGQGL